MKEHIEHIDTSKMTEQELQFHYFKMHDTDGNNKLDVHEATSLAGALFQGMAHFRKIAPQQSKVMVTLPDAVVATTVDARWGSEGG